MLTNVVDLSTDLVFVQSGGSDCPPAVPLPTLLRGILLLHHYRRFETLALTKIRSYNLSYLEQLNLKTGKHFGNLGTNAWWNNPKKDCSLH